MHTLEKERDEARKERDEARKERDALRQERDDLQRQLLYEEFWRIAACEAHVILSRGIKQALKLKNWPDFYKLYGGDGLFATGVVRLLNETMDAKDKQIKELKNESSKVRKPKKGKS